MKCVVSARQILSTCINAIEKKKSHCIPEWEFRYEVSLLQSVRNEPALYLSSLSLFLFIE